MLIDGVRHCDVCDETIPTGQPYACATIPQNQVSLARSIMECEGTLEPSGALRLDLCVDCRMGMTLGTVETVN